MMIRSGLLVIFSVAFVRYSHFQYPKVACHNIFDDKLALDIDYEKAKLEVQLSQPVISTMDFRGNIDNIYKYSTKSKKTVPSRVVVFQYSSIDPIVKTIRAKICYGSRVPTTRSSTINFKVTLQNSKCNSSRCSNTLTTTTARISPYIFSRNQSSIPKSDSTNGPRYSPDLSTCSKTSPTKTTPLSVFIKRLRRSIIPTSTTARSLNNDSDLESISQFITSSTTLSTISTTGKTKTTLRPTKALTTNTSRPLPRFLKKLRPPTLEHTNAICGQENSNEEVKKLAANAHNGEVIPTAKFPWIVAIFRKNLSGLAFQCGGSLISPTAVISAAHCFYDGFYLISEAGILASLGRHNLTNWSDSDLVHRDAERIIHHPDYRPELVNADADLAIIRLNETVTFTHSVRPICLWDGTLLSLDVQDIVGVPGIVVGWGRDENNSMTYTPKLVNAIVASEISCLKSSETFFSLTSNRTLCAGNRNDSGPGPCSGDSGNGLMIRMRNRWMLRGIVSVGLITEVKQCNLKEYVVYTDIAQFFGWIFANML